MPILILYTPVRLHLTVNSSHTVAPVCSQFAFSVRVRCWHSRKKEKNKRILSLCKPSHSRLKPNQTAEHGGRQTVSDGTCMTTVIVRPPSSENCSHSVVVVTWPTLYTNKYTVPPMSSSSVQLGTATLRTYSSFMTRSRNVGIRCPISCPGVRSLTPGVLLPGHNNVEWSRGRYASSACSRGAVWPRLPFSCRKHSMAQRP